MESGGLSPCYAHRMADSVPISAKLTDEDVGDVVGGFWRS